MQARGPAGHFRAGPGGCRLAWSPRPIRRHHLAGIAPVGGRQSGTETAFARTSFWAFPVDPGLLRLPSTVSGHLRDFRQTYVRHIEDGGGTAHVQCHQEWQDINGHGYTCTEPREPLILRNTLVKPVHPLTKFVHLIVRQNGVCSRTKPVS
ncbi:hypothetical protein N657DRAFT_646970 [Parathielavia appendiculata]|uniref:Uncharacterized protein n=1 Tax=Parathielavia appendiculata TaxID=2587402 RepID=A0AAN6Z277_9PEZI|nr:hypothetical protein N657DRAFT_646970 [Parathielavia appendiculata]